MRFLKHILTGTVALCVLSVGALAAEEQKNRDRPPKPRTDIEKKEKPPPPRNNENRGGGNQNGGGKEGRRGRP